MGEQTTPKKADVNEIAFLLLLTITFLIAYYTHTKNFTGFYEPDDYYHFAVIRAAVLHNFVIPKIFGIAGWPQHATIYEPNGLYWITLIPYFFLRYVGISYLTVMTYVPLAYAFLTMISVYFLMKYLSKDRLLGILAMLFIALSPANASRTSILTYRGDGFISLYLILALIFLIRIFKNTEKKQRIISAVASGFFLSLCMLVWLGWPFVIGIFAFTIAIFLAFSFIFDNKDSLMATGYAIGALFVWFVLSTFYVFVGWTIPGLFNGLNFFVISAPLLAAWLLIYYIMNERTKIPFLKFLDTNTSRAITVFICITIGLLIMWIVFSNFLYQIFIGNGIVGSASGFTKSIDELQSPTRLFYFESFSLQSLTIPMFWIMYLATGYASQTITLLFWILVIIVSGIYLFFQIDQSENKFFSGKARLAFGMNPAIIVILSYFIVTSYVQMTAIRFNELMSLPIAMLGAYTVYWLVLKALNSYGKMAVALSAAVALIAVIATYYQVVYTLATTDPYAKSFMVFLLAATTLLLGFWIWNTRKLTGNQRIVDAACFIILSLMFVLILYYTFVFTYTEQQAADITPQFLHSLSWLKNNSANNSVVLTLWPEGSVVEGAANRTSVTDSVSPKYSLKAIPFARWLLNSSQDPQFLTSNISGKPDYLLVRYYWPYVTSGIYAEASNSTTLPYYLLNLPKYHEKQNATTEFFNFSNNSTKNNYVAYVQKLGNRTNIGAYEKNGSALYPVEYLAFSDLSTGNYTIYKNNVFNNTNNQTMLISYSDVPLNGSFLNISFAYLINNALADTNMMKFLFFCGAARCEYNNSVAKLDPVYLGTDTKIFKIIYYRKNSPYLVGG